MLIIAITITAGYFRGAGITVLENDEVDEARTTALSFMGSIRSVFWIIGPIFFGKVIDIIGLKNMFYLASCACGISLIIFIKILAYLKKGEKNA